MRLNSKTITYEQLAKVIEDIFHHPMQTQRGVKYKIECEKKLS